MFRLIARLLFIPSILWNLLLCRVLHRRRWWSRVDDHILLGALPLKSHVPELVAEGVRAVVNTCEEYAGPVEAYGEAGIEQLRLPTVDFVAPTLENVERGVEFINHHVSRGETVYVHCKAGRGRSATIVLCYLIASANLTPQEAQKHLKEKRPQVAGLLYRRRVVEQFYDRYAARRNNNETPLICPLDVPTKGTDENFTTT